MAACATCHKDHIAPIHRHLEAPPSFFWNAVHQKQACWDSFLFPVFEATDEMVVEKEAALSVSLT
jgi:hypothetical protein